MHVQTDTALGPRPPLPGPTKFIEGYRAARLDWKRGLVCTTYPTNSDPDWRDGYRRFLKEFDGLIADRRIADLKKCGAVFVYIDVTDTSIDNRKRISDRLIWEAKRLAHLAHTDPFNHFYNLPFQRMIQRLCKQEMATLACLTGEGA